jgi:hypothetical protein
MQRTKLNELIEDGKSVKGRWVLTPHHELQYLALDDEKQIKLKGTLMGAEPDALLFSYFEKEAAGKTVIRLAKLQGNWKANSKNQIVFDVARQSGRNDELTLAGTWKVNKAHQIEYAYDTIQLKTKKKKTQSIVLSGVWDITEKNRITYLVGGNSDSTMRFRGAFQSKSILAKKGEIRYQVGVEGSEKQSRGKKIVSIDLFGKWKYSDQVGLFFEVEYQKGQRPALIFGGDYALAKNGAVEVSLKTRQEESLGVDVILTKEIFKNADAFVRFQRSLDETRVEAGVKASW